MQYISNNQRLGRGLGKGWTNPYCLVTLGVAISRLPQGAQLAVNTRESVASANQEIDNPNSYYPRCWTIPKGKSSIIAAFFAVKKTPPTLTLTKAVRVNVLIQR